MKKTKAKLLTFILAAVMVLSPLYSAMPAAADDNGVPATNDSSTFGENEPVVKSNTSSSSSIISSVLNISSSLKSDSDSSTSSSSKSDSDSSISSSSKSGSVSGSSSSGTASSSGGNASSDTPAAPQYSKTIPYSGDTVTIQNAEGGVFRMMAPQDGTTCVIKDGSVQITYIPKSTTVYGALHYGTITDNELTKDVTAQADGSYLMTLDKSVCGTGIAIAPIKIEDGKTTNDQYYLCIPAEDKLPVEDPEPEVPTVPRTIEYTGDAVAFQKADGSAFGMLAPQAGSTWALNGDKVEITIIPKNTTVYGALHYGLITDTPLTQDVVFQANGNIVFEISKENCGKGIAVAPVKKSDGGTTKDQYYLCIPAEDKLPVAEPTVPRTIEYTGDAVAFQKADGSAFGMLAPQDGSTWALNGDKVEITIIPKNTTVYGALHYGLITDLPLTQDVVFQDNGNIVFEIGKENCGKGIAVAPVKKSDGGTTKDQYYLCIPAEDKLPVAEPTVPRTIEYTGDAVAFQKADGSAFGMLAPQAGSNWALNGDKVEITIIPKNTTVYGALHYGLITDTPLTQDVVFQANGNIVFEISKENCGKGIAVAPVKKSDGGTTKDQYYLCIPSVDKLTPVDESAVELTPENLTKMFKAVTASYSANSDTLTVALSGSGYHEFFKGIYEDALANGLNEENWIHGYVNSENKWEFVIPVAAGETKIPIISISDAHLQKVKTGEETLDQALFARMFVLDIENKTLTVGDYEDVIAVQVISKTDSFKAESTGAMEVIGSPSSNNYACAPTITMKDGTYTKAFIGTAADAAKEGAAVIELTDGKFTLAFVNTQDTKSFEDKKPIAVAFYDSSKSAWTDFKLTIDKSASTVTVEALAQDEPAPVKPDDKNNNSNTNNNTDAQTKAADASTTLADGIYTPESFGFSGGTGKVVLNCTQIRVSNGQAYATITFTKPNGEPSSYDAVRAAGGEYSGNNTFEIPVDLNTNMTIYGRTTAMSQPHWIEYTIFIGLTEPGKDTSSIISVSDNKETLDATAPTIPGLKYVDEVKVEYTDLLKIYEYENGYYLVEMNLYEGTYRDSVEYRTAALVAAKEKAAVQTAQQSSYDEEGNYIAPQSDSEKVAELYSNEVVKYLVVPENKQIPAGLEKELIVIRQPADKTYISSAEALKYLEALKADGNITAIGLTEDNIEDEAIKARLALGEGEEGRIVFAGEYDDWDIKTMLLEKNNFAISSSEILPNNKETVEEDLANLIRLGERANQLDGMAMFIDRSADEKNDLAKAEWNKVYGVIYGQKEAAEEIYKTAVAAATDEEKAAALKDKDERTRTRNENAAAVGKNAE